VHSLLPAISKVKSIHSARGTFMPKVLFFILGLQQKCKKQNNIHATFISFICRSISINLQSTGKRELTLKTQNNCYYSAPRRGYPVRLNRRFAFQAFKTDCCRYVFSALSSEWSFPSLVLLFFSGVSLSAARFMSLNSGSGVLSATEQLAVCTVPKSVR
jgi:hypothetical protein